MNDSEQRVLCLNCAILAFQVWKGWCAVGGLSRYKPLPDVPELVEGQCSVCQSSDGLLVDRIFYRNIHGPYNTGLPDYFVLEIAEPPLAAEHPFRRWGRPYQDKGIGRVQMSQLAAHVKRLYPKG